MIINSLLDTDLYKLTMMQLVFHRYKHVPVKYEFKSRGNESLVSIKQYIIDEISDWKNLTFQHDEIEYLRSLGYFKNDFLLYLSNMNLRYMDIRVNIINNELSVTVEGTWLETILAEVPILAIVNELYYKHNIYHKSYVEALADGIDILSFKLKSLPKGFKFTDFGTRRRFSCMWQGKVIEFILKHRPEHFAGTSNVMYAMKYNITPIGTMAHEFLQAFQGLVHPRQSQKESLKVWLSEYSGKLGIALTDVIGMDAFLRDFGYINAEVYDGLRHDSGDPYVWADKAINYYHDLGINTQKKTLVFSDGLTFPRAIEIYERYTDTINVSFGIGTNLTNSVGYVPLKIVMKMVKCNRVPVAKISDSEGKGMCKSASYVQYLKEIFNVVK